MNVETFCGECFFWQHGFVNNCAEILALIEAGKIDTTPLITHRYKLDGVIKIAIE